MEFFQQNGNSFETPILAKGNPIGIPRFFFFEILEKEKNDPFI